MHKPTELRNFPDVKHGTIPEHGGEAKSRLPPAPIRHLYLHIPFCPRICPYCAFHVLRVDKGLARSFAENLRKEWESHQKHLHLETIYVGGGTPTALSVPMLQELLDPILQSQFRIQNSEFRIPPPLPTAEVSMECNPSTLSPQKAGLLAGLGVNRLSIGAQSFDPEILRVLGRAHSPACIAQCVATARDAGFQNLNLDLMFGVPGQSLESWEATLNAALALRPRHVSCYGLTYEQDTEFFRRRNAGQLREAPELERAMFDLADSLLTSAGYRHYEISNYAQPGFECRHNVAVWRGKDYLGLGPSAVSTFASTRRRNSVMDANGAWTVAESETLSPATRAAERMVLGLRTRPGVDLAAFVADFGASPLERWPREIRFLAQNGLLLADSSRLQLTARGWEVADEVAPYFV